MRAPLHMSQRNIDSFVASHSDWIASHMTRQRLRRENHPEPDSDEKACCIKRAREYLPERVGFYSSLMDLQPAGITITGARTRFGSCSGKKRLSFSWRLMQYPDEAIDYVVVHELAHLRYMNHSKEFYELIEKFLPDYKQRRKLLKE